MRLSLHPKVSHPKSNFCLRGKSPFHGNFISLGCFWHTRSHYGGGVIQKKSYKEETLLVHIPLLYFPNFPNFQHLETDLWTFIDVSGFCFKSKNYALFQISFTCPKWIIKTQKWKQWRYAGVITVSFEMISHTGLVFPLLLWTNNYWLR